MNSPAIDTAVMAAAINHCCIGCFHPALVHCSCHLLGNVPVQLHNDLGFRVVDPCMLAAVDTVVLAGSILLVPEEQHCDLPAVPARECESAAENETNYL